LSAEYFLSIQNLSVYYATSTVPVRAVEGVTLSAKKNEILGIVGESGCGKSTLAIATFRLIQPPGYIKAGKVVFDNVDILKLSEEEFRKTRWDRVSLIPQSSMNALNPVMRIERQIEDAIRAHRRGISKTEMKKRVEELLASVGLEPRVSKMYPHELSGGMKQRVIIAMAIALSPDLIIADEPTTALDVVVQKGILQLLQDIKQNLESTIILITHDMAAQSEIADRLAVMYAGKIAEIGEINAMFKNPLHPYTQALQSAVPSIVEKKTLKGLSGLPPDLRNPPAGCNFHPRCPYYMRGKCDVDEPKLMEIKKGRFAACHLQGD